MSDQHGGHPQQGGGWQQPQPPQQGGWPQQQPQQGGWQQPQQGWQQPGGYPPQQGWQQQGYPGYPPAQPKVNPFLGVPVGDFIRDGVALVALFSTLAMPWDLGNDANDRWWVIIAVLISVVSLSVPYVVKSGAIPGWGPAQ